MTWKNEKKSKALLVVFGIYLALLAGAFYSNSPCARKKFRTCGGLI